MLNETGVVLMGITCDNPPSNWKCMELLGADFHDPNNLEVTLSLKNILDIPILVIFDVCHLIKLLRNSYGDLQEFISEGKTISWKYVILLHELQSKNGLHLANRLRNQHVNYKENKMKTSLACQTFSKAVSNSINYLRLQNYREFKDSEETSYFINLVNDMFDHLNSKSKFGKYLKGPLSAKNFDIWTKNFDKYTDYILNMTHIDGTPVVGGKRKAAFLGFIVAMKSFRRATFNILNSLHHNFKICF